ncbi:MAG: hypothetical protein HXY43_08675 [Fischerella sp.]|uniref:hypothetical protein n=1 Tax=Fischerella sp. TaxID=1191 RepID=UPI0018484EFD|nr:hypothetical protein [Fischerella sp.]NWF59366.1 hypothetical protein [Fischerella sp.]
MTILIGGNTISSRDRFHKLSNRLLALNAECFPVVLGGDCSILLGNLLALRRFGRYG